MRVDAWTAVDSIQYEGDKYVSCSHRCLDQFQEWPERYVQGSSVSDLVTYMTCVWAPGIPVPALAIGF